ncbi:hypothetical protein Snoj_17450 [Streptomyces nojiriensis]|uniref:DUF3618 domain-containing protein n=1 Tax=Streptomyces nojiriensis TaxID=66374 RepID=A0ABQ3SI55_9ACTN|nr:DUF3618 domain-containing protein [Streptomyces nojiriensis]QTI49447.1 hypothetical protein JYK04_07319 [Streptomyces nojiriensis]GGS35446.1 hypothetical protein GCM10010205_77000 [Streptomyces nojiriensis]GHI67827.1 hypothetical protein Snoj_17450 [Streptomyces nojiriensis]
MTNEPRTAIGTPTPDELREQVERTRDGLGQTIEALADKADITAQAREKAAAVKEQAAATAGVVADRIRTKTLHVAQLVKDTTPEPVLDKAGRAASVARANRKPLLVAGGAALIVLLLVRRGRRSR